MLSAITALSAIKKAGCSGGRKMISEYVLPSAAPRIIRQRPARSRDRSAAARSRK